MKINIKNKDVELKYSFRAFIIYENMMDAPFQPTGKMIEFISLFYATIMSSDRDMILDYDEFIDWLDENPDTMSEFTKWLTENINKNNELSNKSEEDVKETGSKNA